jgi:superfamily II DNA or RNA helicase
VRSLRPYQRQAIDTVFAHHRRGARRPAIQLATGLGKTFIFAHAITEWMAANPGQRALALAHRTELTEQAAAELTGVAPHLRTGVVMGTRNDTLADVVVASPQTLANLNRRRQLLDVGLVVVDECHHYAAPSYARVLDYFGEQGAVFLGVTATFSRGDSRALGRVWDDVVFSRDIAFGVQGGYLVRPHGKRVRIADLDTTKIKKSAGDYEAGALGSAIEGSMAPEKIAEAIRRYAADRSTVVFCPTVHSAEVVRDAIRAEGFTCETVSYLTEKGERRRIIEDYRAGRVQVLTNPMLLTEGFDAPRTSCVVVARMTSNQALWIQMVGRGLRPWLQGGKTDCLVLDLVGASERHGLHADVRLFGEEGYEETEPCWCDGLSMCTCPRGKCAEDCGCKAAGGRCTCIWPEPQSSELPEPEQYVTGQLAAVDVDLFGASRSAWLRTAAGIAFLPAGERLIAIVPGVAGWDVVAMNRWTRGDSRWVMRGCTDLGLAMGWAEGDVTPTERRTALKGKRWRASVPSAAQLRQAAQAGIPATDAWSVGEITDALLQIEASARIDPIVMSMGVWA